MNRQQFETKARCYGIKENGERCTRTKLQPNGYCFQHQHQFPAEEHHEEEPPQQPPSTKHHEEEAAPQLQRQNTTFLPPKGKEEEVPISSSSSSSLLSSEEEDQLDDAAASNEPHLARTRRRHGPPSPSSPSPQDVDDHDEQQPRPSTGLRPPPPMPMPHFDSSPASQDEDEEDEEEDSDAAENQVQLLVMHQCEAIAKSTGVQCRKLVSFAGERFCASHGGRQKAPLQPLLPQCAAIANSTRRQCLRHVSIPGETYCPHHGGLSKKAVQQQNTPARPQVALLRPVHAAAARVMVPNDDIANPSIIVPWPVIHTKSLRFLMQEHGEAPCRQCELDDQPCAPLAVVLWLQRLAQLCARHHLTQPTTALLTAWLAEPLPAGTRDLFELTVAASRLFGAVHTRWLLAAVCSAEESRQEDEASSGGHHNSSFS